MGDINNERLAAKIMKQLKTEGGLNIV